MRERLHTYSNAFVSCYNASTLVLLHDTLPVDLQDL